MMWMISFLKNITTTIQEFFFPSYCFLCGGEDVSLCNRCLSRFSKSVDSPFPFIASFYSFKEPGVKKITHAIKYFHRKDLIPPITKEIIHEILIKNLYHSYIIVPIPMPLLRKNMRGHNHTESIAKHIAKHTELSISTSLLLRHHHKKRQVTTKSRSERLRNQQNAFIVTKRLTGEKILLIDDVTTTGATLLHARKILLAHGAGSVQALTIAH